MNAAILLVSSAWMVGQTPEVIIPVNHSHRAAASCGTSCGASCGDCCNDGIGQKLRDRFQGLFNRGDCCDNGCGHARHSFHRERCHDSCNSCDSCGRRFGNGQILGRLKGMFHRDSCCDAGCGGASAGPAGAEPIKEQPKKMPSKNPAPAKEASVIIPPAQAPLPAIENAPAIAPAPGLAPRIIENDTRNPF